MQLSIRGLATGIGSLPHKDAGQALDLIFKYSPKIPFWPQLPKRDFREGMIAQFSEGLPCIQAAYFLKEDNIKEKNARFNAENKEKELEVFYEKIIKQDIDYFKISQEFSQGIYAFYQRLKEIDLNSVEFIKCQITGPFTFGASINDEKGRALLYDPVFMQVIINILKMKALWQVELFKEFGKKNILFIDEPYLASFGSAYTSINREEIVNGLTELTEGIKPKDVLIGAHCCGNTDWSIFTDVEKIDIINFDAFGFTEKLVLYASNLKGFFERGGILCWGIAPTGEESADFLDPNYLLGKIEDGIKILVKKGLNEDLIRSNLLLSPSCGLGTSDEIKAAKVFAALSEVSSIFRG